MKRLAKIATALALTFGPVALVAVPAFALAGAPQTHGLCNVNVTSGTFSGTGEQANVHYSITCTLIPTSNYYGTIYATTNFGSDYYYFPIYFGGTGTTSNFSNVANSPTEATLTRTYSGYTGLATNCYADAWSSCNTAPTQASDNSWWYAAAPIGFTGTSAFNGFATDASSGSPYQTEFGWATINGMGGAVNNACQEASVAGDYSEPKSNGTSSYIYSVDWVGSNTDEIVLQDDAVTTGTTTTIYGKTFYLTGIGTYQQSGLDLTAPVDVGYTPPSGDVINPDIWCHYGGTIAGAGGWIHWGPISANTSQQIIATAPDVHSSVFNMNACFDTTTWSVSNLYLSGMLHSAECLAQGLFEPVICTYTGQTYCLDTNTLLSNIQTKIPTGYLVDAFAATSTIISGINSSTTSGACTPPNINFFAGVPTTGLFSVLHGFTFDPQLPVPADVCPSSTAPDSTTLGEIYGYRGWILDIEELALTFAFIAIIWRMMPWSKPGDGIEIIAKFSDMNMWGYWVDVEQTNEGSDK